MPTLLWNAWMNLESTLYRMIKLDGPMRLDRFMAIVSEHYYLHNQVFGTAGDFITSPSISPYFAQTIANWMHKVWQHAGCPEFKILELGAGDGTLMSDLLHSNHRKMLKAIKSVEMIEQSQNMVDRQRGKLSELGYQINWRRSIKDIDKIFTFVIANSHSGINII